MSVTHDEMSSGFERRSLLKTLSIFDWAWALLVFAGENRKQLQLEYGNISGASIGAIQRRLLVLEDLVMALYLPLLVRLRDVDLALRLQRRQARLADLIRISNQHHVLLRPVDPDGLEHGFKDQPQRCDPGNAFPSIE
mgnify:CR=1 FL=1